jgi:hypothetical protein
MGRGAGFGGVSLDDSVAVAVLIPERDVESLADVKTETMRSNRKALLPGPFQ